MFSTTHAVGVLLSLALASLDPCATSAWGLSLGGTIRGIRQILVRGKTSAFSTDFAETKVSERKIVVLPRDVDDGDSRDSSYDDDEHYDDSFLMGLALEEARRAAVRGEVPIGAVVVRRRLLDAKVDAAEDSDSPLYERVPPSSRYYEVLSSCHNLVETSHDASAHAEILSLRSAASSMSNWRLQNCTLYSTLEPCPMCLSASQAFRVGRVVYGAPDIRLGAVESYMTMLDGKNVHPYHGEMKVKGGVRADESAELMREFFRERRREKKRVKCEGMSSEGKDLETQEVAKEMEDLTSGSAFASRLRGLKFLNAVNKRMKRVLR